MVQAVTARAGAALFTLTALEGVARACPACAAGGDGGSTWLLAVLIAVPIAGFAAAALAVRHLVARARRP